MSAVASAPPIVPSAGGKPEKQGMSRARKIGYSVLAAWLGGGGFFLLVYGFKGHKAPDVASGVFSPVDEFKLDTWFKVGPISFNKGVLYLLLAAGLTIAVM